MCDTLIASAEAAKHQRSIFAKNSDRPPNEAQHLVRVEGRGHAPGAEVECTYIRIPQARQTRTVLLSKPHWMWGAEMGTNQSGLAIGNEAIYAKVPANKEPALLGMDLLRLALERADTPEEAVEVIVGLLLEYGQGGNCVRPGEMYYHNSFLIANAEEAWVLETVDKDWAARRVGPVYSISNVLTLGGRWDRSSEGMAQHAGGDLDKTYSDLIYTTFSGARARCDLTRSQLEAQRGAITVESMAGILREHGVHPDPASGLTKSRVCMHAGFGPIRISQSTASLAAVLDGADSVVFATGTSAPCTGIFKPLWVDAPLPEIGPPPGVQFDPASLFWAHERLHRAVVRQYPERMAAYAAARDALEAEFIAGALALAGAPAEERAEYSARCFRQAEAAEEEWLGRVLQVPEKPSLRGSLQRAAWDKFDREAGFAAVPEIKVKGSKAGG